MKIDEGIIKRTLQNTIFQHYSNDSIDRIVEAMKEKQKKEERISKKQV